MDRLTAIKIKYEDGTYSDEIPIYVTAENVEYNDEYSLIETLGYIDIKKDGTIQEQINKITSISARIPTLENRIANIQGGTPTVVNSISDMIDTDQIYILSTDSKWYYYNLESSSWVVGGTYGGVPTDTTLTQSGMAADAKKTGDAINEISRNTRNLFNIQNLASSNITVSNGISSGTARHYKNDHLDGIPMDFTFEENTQYVFSFKGRNVTGSGTGAGLTLYVSYTDGSTSTQIKLKNTDTDFTEASGVSKVGKTVRRAILSYASEGDNIWELKDFQIEKGFVQTAYTPYKTANDVVARETDFSRVSSVKNIANANSIASSLVGETITVDHEIYELGNITMSSTGIFYNSSMTRVRTKKSVSIYLKRGTVISITDGRFYVGFVNKDGGITAEGWVSNYTMPEDGACYLLLSYTTEAPIADLDTFLNGLVFTPPTYTPVTPVTPATSELGDMASFPLRFKSCYDHLFVNDTRIVIPHESVYHVRLSRSMGFNVIETNVAGKTSDGKFIVNHLNNGRFGRYFYALDGTDISNVAVNSVTWSEIVSNIRYNTEIVKYRTRPCTLEEFLMECRQQNIIPFVQSTLAGVLDITDDIMGKYNYIAYGVSRVDCPKGIIYHWKSLTTKAEILSYCESIGKPFIYGMSNPTAFSDADLQDIVDTLHANGYWIGTSYADSDWYKYSHMGFDALGALKTINRINTGNVCNIDSTFGFSGFTYTNATETDGVLTYSASGTLAPSFTATVLSVGGIDLEMVFNGAITVPSIGRYAMKKYTSDGSYPVFVALPIINGNPELTLTVDSGTTIYDVTYKVSEF